MAALVGGTIPFYRTMPAHFIPVALADEPVIRGKDGLVVLSDRPLSAETPAHLLDDAHHTHREAFCSQQRHPARKRRCCRLDPHNRRLGRDPADPRHRRSEAQVRGPHPRADPGMRGQRPRLLRSQGYGRAVDLRRRRLLGVDRRPPRRRAQSFRCEERRHLYRARGGGHAPIRHSERAPDLTWRAHRQGHGPRLPHRLRPERPADPPHERRAAAPGFFPDGPGRAPRSGSGASGCETGSTTGRR